MNSPAQPRSSGIRPSGFPQISCSLPLRTLQHPQNLLPPRSPSFKACCLQISSCRTVCVPLGFARGAFWTITPGLPPKHPDPHWHLLAPTSLQLRMIPSETSAPRPPSLEGPSARASCDVSPPGVWPQSCRSAPLQCYTTAPCFPTAPCLSPPASLSLSPCTGCRWPSV